MLHEGSNLSRHREHSHGAQSESASGPPFTHIDRGCLCNYPKEPTVCGQGLISECFGHDAQMFVDPSYDNTKCSHAEKTHHSSYLGQFPHDSLDSTGATLVYPITDTHFVFGGLDTSGAVPAGHDWAKLDYAESSSDGGLYGGRADTNWRVFSMAPKKLPPT